MRTAGLLRPDLCDSSVPSNLYQVFKGQGLIVKKNPKIYTSIILWNKSKAFWVLIVVAQILVRQNSSLVLQTTILQY